MPGKGDVVITGNLKSVMQESAAPPSRSSAARRPCLGLDPEFLKTIDLHVHVPKGGTPKDGPSAGVTMFTAVASLLLNCPVKKDVAMTGEITLRGNVLPVGGIKEKLLAAHRAGIKVVLIPARNERDLEDVPKDVLADLTVHLIKRVDEILPLVLEPPVAARRARRRACRRPPRTARQSSRSRCSPSSVRGRSAWRRASSSSRSSAWASSRSSAGRATSSRSRRG